MLKVVFSVGALFFLSQTAFAQSDPIDDTAKAVDQAGQAVSKGISEQTQWVGQTIDGFLGQDESQPAPPPPMKHHHKKP